MALMRATDVKTGDLVKGSGSPVRGLCFANGDDGKELQMIGGDHVKTAYALRISFEDGSEVLVHPSMTLDISRPLRH